MIGSDRQRLIGRFASGGRFATSPDSRDPITHLLRSSQLLGIPVAARRI
jgi:hypothetical protein